jgi:hypothetical protein
MKKLPLALMTLAFLLAAPQSQGASYGKRLKSIERQLKKQNLELERVQLQLELQDKTHKQDMAKIDQLVKTKRSHQAAAEEAAQWAPIYAYP